MTILTVRVITNQRKHGVEDGSTTAEYYLQQGDQKSEYQVHIAFQ